MMEISQEILIYSILALSLMVFITFILCFILWFRINEQKKRYDFFMGLNRRPSQNLEKKLEEFYNDTKQINENYEELLNMVTDIDAIVSQNIQKVGLIRYNPFDEMGGNLCFALALLDGKNSGVVINGIHSRTGSFTYAKPIELGVSTYLLSDEEVNAVALAKENAHKPEHEKVVKVKFKPSFKKSDIVIKNSILEEYREITATVRQMQNMTDLTNDEQDLIFEDEEEATRIAQVFEEPIEEELEEELIFEEPVRGARFAKEENEDFE